MVFDNITLFAANAVILTVMAIAFLLAARDQDETFWPAWAASNLVLATALVIYIFNDQLAPVVSAGVPHGMLVLGFGIRLHAARLFTGSRSHPAVWIVPTAIFIAVCAYPVTVKDHGTVFTVTNILLTLLAFACAAEFARKCNGELPSRLGLVFAYSIMGASFAVRIVQGLTSGNTMVSAIPNDLILMVHLVVALIHTIASGAFAMSIAYERKTLILREAARRDALTGLLNRGAFEADARRLLALPAAAPLSIAVIDLDHFKSINDRFGHATGDAALIACASALRSVGGGLAARIGGEEFALLLPAQDEDSARRIVENLLATIRMLAVPAPAGHTIQVTASAGLCHCATGGSDLEALMRVADQQLYRAKDNGRDRSERAAA